jgi:hypothetical protein
MVGLQVLTPQNMTIFCLTKEAEPLSETLCFIMNVGNEKHTMKENSKDGVKGQLLILADYFALISTDNILSFNVRHMLVKQQQLARKVTSGSVTLLVHTSRH